ncbi:MAG: hypothetical protein OXG58_01985 [Gemmatimonadetes bacterium]|nr:hypothetical protein [Gemmatimonadota bacterium]MCY3943608.1 hypothetical protein [Gemmatimonadota bacterium]
MAVPLTGIASWIGRGLFVKRQIAKAIEQAIAEERLARRKAILDSQLEFFELARRVGYGR